MDAVEYLMYVKKMCEEYMCDDCPIGRDAEEKGCSCDTYKKIYPSDAVRIVEEWSKDNPLQTNAQKFEEVFGRDKLGWFWRLSNAVEYETPRPLGDFRHFVADTPLLQHSEIVKRAPQSWMYVEERK